MFCMLNIHLHCDFVSHSINNCYQIKDRLSLNKRNLEIWVNFEGDVAIFILWKLSANNLLSWRLKTSLERRIARCIRAQALLGASSGLFHHWRHHVIWWQRITTTITLKKEHHQMKKIQIFCVQNWSFTSMTFLMSLKRGKNIIFTWWYTFLEFDLIRIIFVQILNILVSWRMWRISLKSSVLQHWVHVTNMDILLVSSLSLNFYLFNSDVRINCFIY